MSNFPAPSSASSPLEGLYLDCIHCGLCLPACPTYRELGTEADSPRGRIYLMRALAEGRLEADEEVRAHLDGCVGCRACETACPAGVRYGALLERVREDFIEPSRPLTPAVRLRRALVRGVASDHHKLALAALPGRLARRLVPRRWLPPLAARALDLLPPGTGWGLPDWLPEWTEPEGEGRGAVAFLAGCAGPALFPAANRAIVAMLARAGYRVWTPPALGCCGAVQAHDGDGAGARARARAAVAVLAPRLDALLAVVSGAGGCGATLREYGHLLGDAGGEAVAAKAQDFSALLARHPLPPPRRSLPWRVAYHDPCHLAHGLGVRAEPRLLIRGVLGGGPEGPPAGKPAGVPPPNPGFVELGEADACCGGAGSYTLLQSAMSDALLGRKLAAIAEADPEVLVTQNPPCLMQLGMGLRRAGSAVKLMHLAELLWAAHGPEAPRWRPPARQRVEARAEGAGGRDARAGSAAGDFPGDCS